MTRLSDELIIALIVATSAIVTALLNTAAGYLPSIIRRRKNHADAADVLVGASVKWAEELREENAIFKKRIARLEQENKRLAKRIEDNFRLSEGTIELLRVEVEEQKKLVRELYRGVGILLNQLEENGLHPAWTPPTLD